MYAELHIIELTDNECGSSSRQTMQLVFAVFPLHTQH
jgi:hypothetical protein